MNYIILLNQFWQLRREVPFSNAEADLYFCLVEISNGLQWKNPFQQSNALIGATIGVSEKTLINARNRLKQNGLIDFDPGSKRNPSTYRLRYLPNTLEKFQGIKEEQGSTNGSTNGSESGSVSGKKAPDIIKHKPKPNKTGANAPSAGGQVDVKNEGGATFSEWRQWCADNAPEVLKLKTQLTADQLDKLYAEFGRPMVFEVFEAMQNKAGLTKTYNSVYLTAKTWCKRRQSDGPAATGTRKPPPTSEDEKRRRDNFL